MDVKQCSRCGEVKHYADYYLRKSGTPMGTRCKKCLCEINREKWADPSHKERCSEKRKLYHQTNREALLVRSADYYKTKRGRVKSMMKTARRRSNKFGEKPHITEEFLLELLEPGVCSVTGIAFCYEPVKNYKCNPYAPSIDRIDSNVGYIKQNVRMVIWQYNLMKGEISDSELLLICERLVNGNC